MANTNIFFHLNSVLIGIVGASVQGTNQPFLPTHAVNIWSFLVSKLVYCFALVAEDVINRQNQANYTHFWSLTAFVSGSLSSVSLVSTFVSRSTADIMLCIAWISAVIIIIVHQYGRLFLDASRWLYYEILKPFFNNIWNRIRDNRMLIETAQPRPSVSV